jgi:hypothetical protein
MRRIAPLIFTLISILPLAACEDAYHPENLYLATTADCANWVDSSRFLLPDAISVLAGAPDAVGDGSLDLNLSYFMPRSVQAQFTKYGFSITQPHGAVIARAKIVAIDRRAPTGPDKKLEYLDKQPTLFRGDADAEQTIFRFRLRFVAPLPERFDLTPAPMIVGGKTYPVRTFTYRLFKDRQAYGLCS